MRPNNPERLFLIVTCILVVGLIALISCTTPAPTTPPPSTPTTPPPSTPTAPPLPTEPTQTVTYEEETSAATPPFGIEIAEGYEIQHILCPELLGPGDVDIGPNGDIFVTEWDGQRIARVGSDGTVSTYVQPDFFIWAMAFNSAGELFSFDGENIVKVSPTGDSNIFVPNIPFGGMAFGPNDELFVLSHGDLIRFTPDGERTVIATGVPGGDMAVSPSGEVFLANGMEGKIFKVDRSGVVTILTRGFVLDAFNIAFDNEGNLYTNQNRFAQVSLENGSLLEPLLWEYTHLINSRPFVFDRSGDIAFVGPTSNTVIKASLADQSVHCLVEGIGNSYALAIDPSGGIFMGASNAYPINPGRIVRIHPDGSISDHITGLNTIHDVTFDNAGNMYISDFDDRGTNRLLKVTSDGSINTIFSGGYYILSIAFHPQSGDILAFEQNESRLLRISSAGDLLDLEVDFGGQVHTADLAMDQSGNLIVLVIFEEGHDTGPVHRGLFKITPDNETMFITDIDTPLATTEDDVFVHPSGDIFVIGPEEHPDFRLLRITPEGDISVVAQRLPFDTLSLAINKDGEIFFTCSAGLFKVSEKDSN